MQTKSSTPPTESVAAVVVTYNRLSDLKRCVDSLRKQSMPLAALVVYDNGSTDGTSEWLASQTDVISLFSNANLGGAGGFHYALKHAYEQQYGWFWLMDDDCSPAPNCLETLMSIDSRDNYAGMAPTVYEDGKVPAAHRSNLTYSANLDTLQKPLNYDAENPGGSVLPIDYASFVGLLLPYRSVSAVGLPRSEFFIHHDDVEYSLRLKKMVGKIALVHDARIDHYCAAKPTVAVKKGKSPYTIDKLWIRFYGIRNNVRLKREGWPDLALAEKLRLTASFVKTLSKQLLDVALHDDHKVKRMRFYTAAYWDGWTGVFDNDKPRAILNSNRAGK